MNSTPCWCPSTAALHTLYCTTLHALHVRSARQVAVCRGAHEQHRATTGILVLEESMLRAESLLLSSATTVAQ